MITLNSERGLVDIATWDDVLQLPAFRKDVDPSEHQLDAIIGRYMFRDKVNCGLSNCHQPHGRGYIVTTKAGITTNIGKDCGRKHFGVDFETTSRKFDRDITEKQNRDRLNSFVFSIEEIESRVKDIRSQHKGADWVYKHTRPLVNATKGCPEEVVRRLRAMVKTGGNSLSNEREASNSEIEQEEARTGRKIKRPHIVTEHVADIEGVQALYPNNDVRALLIDDLATTLGKLSDTNVDALTYNELRNWTKWLDTVESTLERAEAAVGFGRQLLTPVNLEPFYTVLTKRDEKDLFRKFLSTLSSDD